MRIRRTTWERDLREPGPQYRSKPFWALNDTLDPAELCRQVRRFHEMGFGGQFFHARVGLRTAYLGKKWFAALGEVVEESRRLGMETWLYDEDRWPSGFAGGLVTADARYRRRWLRLELLPLDAPIPDAPGEVIASFSVLRRGEQFVDAAPLEGGIQTDELRRQCLCRGADLLIRFSLELEPSAPVFNGATYLDTLNPKAVAAFIESTHQRYAEELEWAFGSAIPGIFTDEPHYAELLKSRDDLRLPWTDRLPQVFEERYGYALAPRLAEIALPLADTPSRAARFHFHDCLTHLFVSSFARPIGEWCAEHGLAFTGHILNEGSLSSQALAVGSCMRFYEHMQIPGMDILTEHWRELDSAKQVASVAHQFGRPWRLTETYGCTGWDFPPEGHKAIAEWQAVLGVNLRVPHLALYSLAGEAKRDFPGSISHHTNWATDYRELEDYLARVTVLTTQGEELRKIGVIHGNESSWLSVEVGWREDWRLSPDAEEVEQAFGRLREAILFQHLDFDYIDEALLVSHGTIRAGAAAEPALLRLARAAYEVVVVPPLRTVRRSTLKLLRLFVEAGGTVFFAGGVPKMVEGRPAPGLAEETRWAEQVADLEEDLPRLLEPWRTVSIEVPGSGECQEVLYQLRSVDEGYLLYLVNTGHRSDSQADVPVVQRRQRFETLRVHTPQGTLQVEEVDLSTGGRARLTTAPAERLGPVIATSLERLESRAFLLHTEVPAPPTSAAPAVMQDNRTPAVSSPVGGTSQWDASLQPVRMQSVLQLPANGALPVRLSEPNALVIDFLEIDIAGESLGRSYVLEADRKVRRRLGLSPRGGDMVQPWARGISSGKTLRILGRYSFTLEELPSAGLEIALETRDLGKLRLNGCELNLDAEARGWWIDRSIERYALPPALLATGRNVIEIELDYGEESYGLEAVYLLGDVSVELDDVDAVVRGPAPRELEPGAVAEQGLPFYAGDIAYELPIPGEFRRKFESSPAGSRVELRLAKWAGTGIRVRFAGLQKRRLWPPYTVDVTEALLFGRNSVILEVIGHRRNLFGPLHHKQRHPIWVGPEAFLPPDHDWQDAPNLVPFGLLEAPYFELMRPVPTKEEESR